MNYLNSIVWSCFIIVIITTLFQSLTTDEQALIGGLVSTLANDMLSFNSACLSYLQQNIEDNFYQVTITTINVIY